MTCSHCGGEMVFATKHISEIYFPPDWDGGSQYFDCYECKDCGHWIRSE